MPVINTGLIKVASKPSFSLSAFLTSFPRLKKLPSPKIATFSPFSISLNLFNFDAYDEKEEVKEESIASKIKNRLDEVDINKLTPLEALNILYELKEMS